MLIIFSCHNMNNMNDPLRPWGRDPRDPRPYRGPRWGFPQDPRPVEEEEPDLLEEPLSELVARGGVGGACHKTGRHSFGCPHAFLQLGSNKKKFHV